MNPDRRIPKDGTLVWVHSDPDLYKHNNIMIIEVPENMRSPSDPFFQLATIDRSIPGNDFDGNKILDKLIPGLPKVTLFEEPEPEDDSPSSPSTNAGSDDDFSENNISKKLYPNVPSDALLEESKPENNPSSPSTNAGRDFSGNTSKKLDLKVPTDTLLEEAKIVSAFSRNSISDKLYPDVPTDALLEKPKPKYGTLPPKKHFPKQKLVKSHQAGYSNAGDRFRPHYYKESYVQRSNRHPSEIHPWIIGNEHCIPRGNRHIPTVSLIAESGPRNLVSSTINDKFVHNRENHPLSQAYPYNSGSFADVLPPPNYSGLCDGLPPPNYPSGTGILGDRPCKFNSHREIHPLPQKYPHNPGSFGDLPPPNSDAFGDVQPPNYSGGFGNVQPPHYSGSFGDVCPPPKYPSGTGLLGHHPLNYNPTSKYIGSNNPNLRDNYPLNNNDYQGVPRMDYRNINSRDDLNQSYQRKKDFRQKNRRGRGHLHAKGK